MITIYTVCLICFFVCNVVSIVEMRWRDDGNMMIICNSVIAFLIIIIINNYNHTIIFSAANLSRRDEKIYVQYYCR